MAEFKHGVYGEMGDSVITTGKASPLWGSFWGTLPVNLVRLEKDAEGNLPTYKSQKLVHYPCKLSDSGAKTIVGYSSNWKTFTLCETMKAFFENTEGIVTPIICTNILDPDTDRKAEDTTSVLTFVNGRCEFISDTIILDTLKLTVTDGEETRNLTEGVEYKVGYNFGSNKVIIESVDPDNKITGEVAASFREIDTSFMDDPATMAERIIGCINEDGTTEGICAMRKIFTEYGVVSTLLSAPGFMHLNKVYNALVSKSKLINDKFRGFVVSDIPTTEIVPAVNTRAKAKEWKSANGRNAENVASVWIHGLDSEENEYHGSTIFAVEQLRLDAKNNGIPFETVDNKPVRWINKLCLDKNTPISAFTEKEVNELNAAGIVSFNNWTKTIFLWGNCTDSFVHDGVYDLRARFSSNIRVQYYLLNDFILRRHSDIGNPMFLQKKIDIMREEQERLDQLVVDGVLIGKPRFEFIATKNVSGEVAEGNFRFDLSDTPTPPINSLTLVVSYTDAGTSIYYE